MIGDSSIASSLQQLPKCGDVTLGHLKRLVLGQLSIVAERRHDVAKPVKGRVEIVHPAAFAGVGGEPALLHHLRGDFFEGPFGSGCAAHAPWRLRVFRCGRTGQIGVRLQTVADLLFGMAGRRGGQGTHFSGIVAEIVLMVSVAVLRRHGARCQIAVRSGIAELHWPADGADLLRGEKR